VVYRYRLYGLRIVSSTPIAGLETEASNAAHADLCLDTGSQPEWVSQARRFPGKILSHLPESSDAADPSFILTEHGNGRCYQLAYSDGTCFVVDGHGSKVWGTFLPPLTGEDLATYFLGPVMGFILRRRHQTSLHSSAVEIHGCAVAFSGEAGAGKSTTAGALALRGFPVLAEDVVPLQEAQGKFLAVPGYPRVCLWPDSVEKLLGRAEALPRLTEAWDKCYLSLDGIQGKFSAEPLPLRLIYLFAARDEGNGAPRIEPISAREALLELVKNTYMNWLLDREQRAIEFDVLSRVVNQVPVRRITAHRDAKKIGALCDLIEEDAGKVLPRR
jgi:hypothetical protein